MRAARAGFYTTPSLHAVWGGRGLIKLLKGQKEGGVGEPDGIHLQHLHSADMFVSLPNLLSARLGKCVKQAGWQDGA